MTAGSLRALGFATIFYFAILLIPPFIGGLCRWGRHFLYVYLPILAASFALFFAATWVMFMPALPSRIFPWTWWSLLIIFVVIVYTCLAELAKAVVAYFFGWGLRALTLRVVRYLSPSPRSVLRAARHPGAPTFGESVTCDLLRQRRRGAFADRALAENAERESRQAERRLPPARQDLYLARPPGPRPPGRG